MLYAGHGRLSDDGLHAYAGRALLHGQALYRDFQYHQPPLLPCLLSGWYRLVGVGLVQARLCALAVSLGCAALVLALSEGAGALWLLALCPSVALHLSYVQTQGLATLLALGSLLALRRERPRLGWALAGLAAGARVSFAVLLLPLLLTRRGEQRGGLPCWLAALLAVYLPVAGPQLLDSLYLPFGPLGGTITRAFGALYFPVDTGWQALARRLGSWPNQVGYYAPLWLTLAWVRRAPDRTALGWAVALTVAHGVLPQRVNHSYLVVAAPCWALVASPALRRVPRWALALALAAALGHGLARVDWRGPGVVAMQRLARTLPPGEPLFTFAVEVAVAADRDVWPGLESGAFACYPTLDPAAAQRCHVAQPELLRQWLELRSAPLLLLGPDSFGPVQRPARPWPDPSPLWQAVRAGYTPVRTWPRLGERGGPLTLYRLNAAGTSPDR